MSHNKFIKNDFFPQWGKSPFLTRLRAAPSQERVKRATNVKPQSVVITLQFGFKQEMHMILWALEIGRLLQVPLYWSMSAVWSDCSQSLFWALAAGLFVKDRHDVSFELLSARKKISTLHQMLKYTYRSTVFSVKTATTKNAESLFWAYWSWGWTCVF